jgi:hypothetical protein
MVKENRVRFTGVRPPQEDDIGLLDFPVRTGSPSSPEYRRQPGDARGVSGAVAAVDIVAANDQSSEFLGDEIHLVGSLRAAEQAERPWSVRLHRHPEPCRGAIQRFFPGRWPQAALITYERLGESDV